MLRNIVHVCLWFGPYSASVLASFPGLLTPAFVACSTNAWEGLVKLVMCNDVGGRYVDVRRSGTFFLYSSGVAFLTEETLARLPDVDRSVAQCPIAVVSSALTYLGFFVNVPLLRMST